MTATPDDQPNSGYQRLEQQIRWYDGKSVNAQRWFKNIKLCEFVLSGLVPITALLADARITALIGAGAVVLEGLQQLNQWQHNWITYRSTCEALRHEKYSYLARSGSYDGMDDARAMKALVERVEALVSTEHAKWITRQEYDPAKVKPNESAA
ncbi:DUF4231 domain-containing protein [Bradyrhizobium sp. 186]|uniref:DUF4231 domain-containing protein n=1 Tax=Bradyrhizobium sp. 186 TaxID=2782654 RepID=UPI002000E0D4|nr:DUF4231 domain-containing protein [Bradyrhizobium sp. 186]UPK33322.1 DUF4231 domain-containing protein [Bradyrhizobium sp. 186]